MSYTNANNSITVQNVSKTFSIAHENIFTLRRFFVTLLSKKGYDEFRAVDNISLTIRKGEFFGIIGRNGSGKSTFLKILAGVYVADSGSIDIQGEISPFLELGIGFNPELSGRDNVYINAAVLGMLQADIDQVFDQIVAFSEIGRFIDQKMKSYSSGMRVRLAFAVAIFAKKDILIMDEVLAVGDVAFQKKCLAELEKLRDEGKTVILVSHAPESLRQFCDRVLVMEKGKAVIIDTPEKALSVYDMIMNKR